MKILFPTAFLILLLTLTPPVLGQQDTYIIELNQSTWAKSTLNVLIIQNLTAEWWQPFFPNMTASAVEQWNDAFTYFADAYPQYSYLADLRLTTAVSDTSLPGYDIYIYFSPDVLISGVDALGESLVESYSNRTIRAATITISAKSEVIDITREIYRDTTTHELGHALGLGHSNKSDDLMYPYQDIIASNYAISTLELYGVALLFQWMTGETPRELPTETTLPTQIEYAYAPVNNPAPTDFLDSPVIKTLYILISNPIILALMITAIIVFIMLGVTVRRRATLRRKYRLTQPNR